MKPVEKMRGNAHERGYDKRWAAYRKRFLSIHVWCADCTEAGKVTIATEVHHLNKLSVDRDDKYDANNLRPLCKRCHSIRTARGE